ncbi:MAG: hypothetical protein Q7S96_04050 [bacterium]|nr:hypothetical protein [bacterium]
MSYLVRSTSSNILEAGIHVVRLKSYEEVQHYSDEERVQLMFEFESFGEKSIRLWTSPTLHPKGKLLPMCEAVLNRKLTSHEMIEGLDLEEMIGRKLKIVVRNAMSQSGKEHVKVTEFLPLGNSESEESA